MPDFACKTKSMSTMGNLTEVVRTTLVQTGGLDKPHRPETLAHAWGLDILTTFLLVKATL